MASCILVAAQYSIGVDYCSFGKQQQHLLPGCRSRPALATGDLEKCPDVSVGRRGGQRKRAEKTSLLHINVASLSMKPHSKPNSESFSRVWLSRGFSACHIQAAER